MRREEERYAAAQARACQKLWLTKIIQHLSDYCSSPVYHAQEHQYWRGKAIAFFRLSNPEFIACCESAGIDPEMIIRGLATIPPDVLMERIKRRQLHHGGRKGNPRKRRTKKEMMEAMK